MLVERSVLEKRLWPHGGVDMVVVRVRHNIYTRKVELQFVMVYYVSKRVIEMGPVGDLGRKSESTSCKVIQYKLDELWRTYYFSRYIYIYIRAPQC